MRTRNDYFCHSVPWTRDFLRLNFFSRKDGTTHSFRVHDTVKNVVKVWLSIQPTGLGLNKDFRLKWGSLKCHFRDASGWEDSRTFESSFWLLIGQEERSRQKRAILVSRVQSHLNETHGVFMSYISSYTACYRLLSDQVVSSALLQSLLGLVKGLAYEPRDYMYLGTHKGQVWNSYPRELSALWLPGLRQDWDNCFLSVMFPVYLG